MKVKQETKGFSLIELMVVVGVMMVIGAFAAPSVLRSLRTYRLNETTREVANMLQQTRYQAISLNRTAPPLSCRLGNIGTRITVYVDLNNNTRWDPNEPVAIMPSDLQFSTAGAPSTASMNLGATTFPAGAISFNARGTVSFPVGVVPATLVVILTYPNQPTYGFRAISVTPVGKTKIWSADSGAGGVWHSQ